MRKCSFLHLQDRDVDPSCRCWSRERWRGYDHDPDLRYSGAQRYRKGTTKLPRKLPPLELRQTDNNQGIYLAIDLGGTNFRVCSVTLNGDSTFSIQQAKEAIPRELMIGDSHSLFSFLAKHIGKFVEEHHSEHFEETHAHRLQLGFTFSFPVDQKAVNKGYLIRWTKGFDIKDAIGKDVCELLQTEIDALGLPVKVAALVNDTVGTLMARSYTSPGKSGTLIGAIFGTGTNGAYVEKLARLTKMTKPGAEAGEYDTSTGEMVVNTEWGSFDNALATLPDSPYDRELDAISVNPGIQMYEKRVSGMFLGEILRQALLDLQKDGLFAKATIKDDAPLYTAWSIDTSALSFIEADETADLVEAKKVLEEQMGVPAASISTEEAKAAKVIVHAIGKRSARLSAVPIAAIVIATGKLNPPSSSTTGKVAPSTTEKVIDTVKAAVTGKPPVADLPATRSAVKSDDAADDDEGIIDVGVDGSVVEFYPGFEKYFREALRDIEKFGEAGEKRIRIGEARDGSGVGAALIALVAAQAAGVKPQMV